MGHHPEVGLLVSPARPHPKPAGETGGRSLQDEKGQDQDQRQRQNLGSHWGGPQTRDIMPLFDKAVLSGEIANLCEIWLQRVWPKSSFSESWRNTMMMCPSSGVNCLERSSACPRLHAPREGQNLPASDFLSRSWASKPNMNLHLWRIILIRAVASYYTWREERGWNDCQEPNRTLGHYRWDCKWRSHCGNLYAGSSKTKQNYRMT